MAAAFDSFSGAFQNTIAQVVPGGKEAPIQRKSGLGQYQGSINTLFNKMRMMEKLKQQKGKVNYPPSEQETSAL